MIMTSVTIQAGLTRALLIPAILGICLFEKPNADFPRDYVAGSLIRLNDNGAWSWFMDERAIGHDGKLIVGSVRAVGDFRNDGAEQWGNVEVSVYDIASGSVNRTTLHEYFQQDDHDSPAFFPLSDGRYLALYTKHAVERRIYYRFSKPRNPLDRVSREITPDPVFFVLNARKVN